MTRCCLCWIPLNYIFIEHNRKMLLRRLQQIVLSIWAAVDSRRQANFFTENVVWRNCELDFGKYIPVCWITRSSTWKVSRLFLAIVKKVEEEAVPKGFLSFHNLTDQWFLSVAEGFAHSFMDLFRNFLVDWIGKSRVRLPFSHSMISSETSLLKNEAVHFLPCFLSCLENLQ